MGKPLISDAQMLAIYRAMQRLQDVEKAQRSAVPGQASQSVMPVAVLATALLQLRTDDVLVTGGEQPLAATTLSLAQQDSFLPEMLPFSVVSGERASAAVFAAGHALAQGRCSRPSDSASVTVALLQPNTPVQEAMRLAGEHLLPLILLLREEPNKPRQAMTAPQNVEIVQVDAEDAVALCRVVQESMLRARNRWGSVVLRVVSLPGSVDPVVAFEAHLRRRGLLSSDI